MKKVILLSILFMFFSTSQTFTITKIDEEGFFIEIADTGMANTYAKDGIEKEIAEVFNQIISDNMLQSFDEKRGNVRKEKALRKSDTKKLVHHLYTINLNMLTEDHHSIKLLKEITKQKWETPIYNHMNELEAVIKFTKNDGKIVYGISEIGSDTRQSIYFSLENINSILIEAGYAEVKQITHFRLESLYTDIITFKDKNTEYALVLTPKENLDQYTNKKIVRFDDFINTLIQQKSNKTIRYGINNTIKIIAFSLVVICSLGILFIFNRKKSLEI